jgi:hypothetical protein
MDVSWKKKLFLLSRRESEALAVSETEHTIVISSIALHVVCSPGAQQAFFVKRIAISF